MLTGIPTTAGIPSTTWRREETSAKPRWTASAVLSAVAVVGVLANNTRARPPAAGFRYQTGGQRSCISDVLSGIEGSWLLVLACGGVLGGETGFWCGVLLAGTPTTAGCAGVVGGGSNTGRVRGCCRRGLQQRRGAWIFLTGTQTLAGIPSTAWQWEDTSAKPWHCPAGLSAVAVVGVLANNTRARPPAAGFRYQTGGQCSYISDVLSGIEGSWLLVLACGGVLGGETGFGAGCCWRPRQQQRQGARVL